uniref:NADAR domain-containing protein n=1 Tax=Romanomermis culicivorax TaxID=13658 RepID=A0A915K863_ROMCU
MEKQPWTNRRDAASYSWFQCKGVRSLVKAKLWHYRMPNWCPKCMKSGHIARYCTTEWDNVDKTNFKLTEHYLFYQKAKLNSQNEAVNTILNTRNAAIAKQMGDAIAWDMAKHGPWHEWAYMTLFMANGYKYEQNPELRAMFFQTSPAQLVKANAYHLY